MARRHRRSNQTPDDQRRSKGAVAARNGATSMGRLNIADTFQTLLLPPRVAFDTLPLGMRSRLIEMAKEEVAAGHGPACLRCGNKQFIIFRYYNNRKTSFGKLQRRYRCKFPGSCVFRASRPKKRKAYTEFTVRYGQPPLLSRLPKWVVQQRTSSVTKRRAVGAARGDETREEWGEEEGGGGGGGEEEEEGDEEEEGEEWGEEEGEGGEEENGDEEEEEEEEGEEEEEDSSRGEAVCATAARTLQQKEEEEIFGTLENVCELPRLS